MDRSSRELLPATAQRAQSEAPRVVLRLELRRTTRPANSTASAGRCGSVKNTTARCTHDRNTIGVKRMLSAIKDGVLKGASVKSGCRLREQCLTWMHNTVKRAVDAGPTLSPPQPYTATVSLRAMEPRTNIKPTQALSALKVSGSLVPCSGLYNPVFLPPSFQCCPSLKTSLPYIDRHGIQF